eukprot:268247-Rhodomonas_salina.1
MCIRDREGEGAPGSIEEDNASTLIPELHAALNQICTNQNQLRDLGLELGEMIQREHTRVVTAIQSIEEIAVDLPRDHPQYVEFKLGICSGTRPRPRFERLVPALFGQDSSGLDQEIPYLAEKADLREGIRAAVSGVLFRVVRIRQMQLCYQASWTLHGLTLEMLHQIVAMSLAASRDSDLS